MDSSRSNNGFVQEHSKNSFFVAFSVSVCIGLVAIAAAVFCLASLIVPAVIGSGYLTIPAIAIAFVGFTCPFFTFFGWRGANREDVKDLRLCRTSMCVYLLFSLFLALYICIGTSYHPGSARNLYQSIVHYHEDSVTARHLDTFQAKVKCCGIKNLYDWNKNEQFSCEEDNPDSLRCSVPSSCCVQPVARAYSFTLRPKKNVTKGRRGAGASKQRHVAHQKQRRRLRIPMNTKPVCGMGALNDSTFVNRRREEVLYTEGCEKFMDDHIKITVLYLEVVTVSFITFFAFMVKMSACALSHLKRSIRRFNRVIRRRVYYNNRRNSDTDNTVFEPPLIVEGTV